MWTDFLASSWILLADWNLLSVSKYTQRQSYFQLLLYGLEVNRSETRCVLLVVVVSSSSLWSDKRVIDIPISDRLQQPIQSLKRWLTITILSNCDTMPQKCRATPNLALQQSTDHIFFACRNVRNRNTNTVYVLCICTAGRSAWTPDYASTPNCKTVKNPEQDMKVGLILIQFRMRQHLTTHLHPAVKNPFHSLCSR